MSDELLERIVQNLIALGALGCSIFAVFRASRSQAKGDELAHRLADIEQGKLSWQLKESISRGEHQVREAMVRVSEAQSVLEKEESAARAQAFSARTLATQPPPWIRYDLRKELETKKESLAGEWRSLLNTYNDSSSYYLSNAEEMDWFRSTYGDRVSELVEEPTLVQLPGEMTPSEIGPYPDLWRVDKDWKSKERTQQ